jgi:hypothetical protein
MTEFCRTISDFTPGATFLCGIVRHPNLDPNQVKRDHAKRRVSQWNRGGRKILDQ